MNEGVDIVAFFYFGPFEGAVGQDDGLCTDGKLVETSEEEGRTRIAGGDRALVADGAGDFVVAAEYTQLGDVSLAAVAVAGDDHGLVLGRGLGLAEDEVIRA